jgi:uncharacterized protein (TIGR02453 family)
MTKKPRFSPRTILFLKKAGRQKRLDWLDKNEAEYNEVLRHPLQAFARDLHAEISPLAPDYHFPLKGIGRLRRPAGRVNDWGGGIYKSWMGYSVSRPKESRFEGNPNLFFMINSEDEDGDTVLVAGGLYMPSSRQVRAIREAIAKDASAFEELFKTKDFAKSFPGGFSDERISSRPPRGFDPAHPKMDWLKLQAFFVWKPYKKKEFASADFSSIVAKDWKQVLRLNRLLEQAIQGRLPTATKTQGKKKSSPKLLDHLESMERVEREMDF